MRNVQEALSELNKYIDIHLTSMVKELVEWSELSILSDGHVRKAAALVEDMPFASIQFVKDQVQFAALLRLLTYQAELEKCSDAAQYAAALNPNHPEVWNGTIAERLKASIELLDSQRSIH
jgi:hypothetical protein